MISSTHNKVILIARLEYLGDKRYYIQLAFSLSDEEKVKREMAALLNVNDSLEDIMYEQRRNIK